MWRTGERHYPSGPLQGATGVEMARAGSRDYGNSCAMAKWGVSCATAKCRKKKVLRSDFQSLSDHVVFLIRRIPPGRSSCRRKTRCFSAVPRDRPMNRSISLWSVEIRPAHGTPFLSTLRASDTPRRGHCIDEHLSDRHRTALVRQMPGGAISPIPPKRRIPGEFRKVHPLSPGHPRSNPPCWRC